MAFLLLHNYTDFIQLLQGVKKIIVNEKQQIEKVKLNQLVETIKKCISKLSKDELSIG